MLAFLFIASFSFFIISSLFAAGESRSVQNHDQATHIVNEAGETPFEGNAEIEQQKDGKFPRLERQHTLGAIQRAWDKAPSQAGIYTVTYSQEQLIRLRLREFMTTTVVLPSWEMIEEIFVGDASTFEAVQKGNHILLLRCKEFVGADSNISVIGKSGLVYTFYVRSEGYNSENLPDLRVHVHVPGEVPMSFSLEGESGGKEKGRLKTSASRTALSSEERMNETASNLEYPSTLSLKLSRLNFKWSMAGDSDIAPRQVFSDGIRTWFNFDNGTGKLLEQQDLPVIARVIDGVDTPVNTRIEGSLVIAETEGMFTLRSGARTICVYPTEMKVG
jgi:ComB9 competence protein